MGELRCWAETAVPGVERLSQRGLGSVLALRRHARMSVVAAEDRGRVSGVAPGV